jgi:hypothetical protein
MTMKTNRLHLAQKTLAAVRRMFAEYIQPGDRGPSIVKDFEWGAGVAAYAVVWEEGPFEWAHLASGGGVDEEMAGLLAQEGLPPPKPKDRIRIDGAYLEPYTSWALGVYRQEG